MINIIYVLFLFTGQWSMLCEFQTYVKSRALEESTKANIRSQFRAYLFFCRAYDISPYPVTSVKYKVYMAFLCKFLRSAGTVFNYLNALRHVNLHMGFDVSFMDDYDSQMMKRAVCKILGDNHFRKSEISIHLLCQIVGCLDDTIPLHCCMKALFLVAFFSFLCKANLLVGPQEGHGDKGAMHLKHEDVTFGRDGAVLCVYRTKTLLQKQDFIHSDPSYPQFHVMFRVSTKVSYVL